MKISDEGTNATGGPTTKKHISPSQIEMYTRCGEQYRRRYVEKHLLPPGIALIKGSAVHSGAEINNLQKIKSHKDLPAKRVVEASVEAYHAKVKREGVFLSAEEETVGQKKVLADGVDATVRLATVYVKKSAPKYQPAEVELTQRIALPDASHDLLGRIDLVTDRQEIVDYKTASKRTNQADVDKNAQLTFYSLTYRALKGRDPKGLKIEQLLDLKVPVAETFSTTRNQADYKALVNRINAVLKGINAGVFVPAVPGAWICSPRFCGYWFTCPFVNAEREAAALKQEV